MAFGSPTSNWRARSAFRDVEGELEALGVKGACLSLHPGLERLGAHLLVLCPVGADRGLLAGQELLDVGGVLDLLAVTVELVLGRRLADLGGAELLEERVDVAGGEVALEGPVDLAAGVAADPPRCPPS